MPAYPLEVFVASACIHHQAKAILGQEIHDEIVDDPACLIQHAGIEGFAGLPQLADVIRQQALQKRADASAVKIDHTHVRNIEHAGGAAHRVMLGNLRAVLDGHVPTAEVDQAGAQLLVKREQRCTTSHGLSRPRTNKKGDRHSSCLPPLCPVT